MSSTLYLPRRLSSNDTSYSEASLLEASDYIVVLAEPGAGKTELMKSLALQLGTLAVTANVYVHMDSGDEGCPLVIDAFDELAKVDKAGIYKLLTHARKAKPTTLILSSRSSEWDNAASHAFKEVFGQEPVLVRLSEFTEEQQKAIFDDHLSGENFAAFQSEVARFDLEALLPNPQFLKLFADAYIESGRRFTDKRSIFSQAVERLAKESNAYIAVNHKSLSTTQKIELSSEVFAMLLLAGCEGISTSGAAEDRMYPLLGSLIQGSISFEGILATGLFKPGDKPEQHRPVHKIVAEYCAANYLVRRIQDPSDALKLYTCLSVIAPNRTVREELRGLLGWMAALGNKPIQEAAIELDPYAVLANGDPSQLEHSSKRILIQQLKEIETKDPYFRRGDFWRSYSAAGFFTHEVVEEIRPLLVSRTDGHLRDLILELLAGSPALEQLENELSQLIINPDENGRARYLAGMCLIDSDDYDYCKTLEALVAEASQTSLKIAAKIIETNGPEEFDKAYLANFLEVCASIYPDRENYRSRTIGARYFIKHFINCLSLETIKWLLDDLSKHIVCKCGKKPYECYCLNGLSKIMGSLMDRYFELAEPPFESERVWQWVENLHYHERKSADQSIAVRVLQEDDDLRQGILSHVFGSLKDRDQIHEIKINFGWHSHSGLTFQSKDYKFLVDLAFDTDNAGLWASFLARHQYYLHNREHGPNSLRRHMREQALEKQILMREWVKLNKDAKQFEREHRIRGLRHHRRMKRRDRNDEDIRAQNIKYVQDNRELVEGGRHWECLVRFANLVLNNPEDIRQEFGDEKLVRNALRNCLDFIDEHVPDLQKLAELQCDSQGLHVETILYAACLEIMRAEGHLEDVSIRGLKALRTGIDIGYSAVSTDDQNALKSELDRLLFPDTSSAESYLRDYIEPQLGQLGCSNPEVGVLRYDEVFSDLRDTLSIEWLKRFDDLALMPMDTLFEIAAKHGNRDALKEIIKERCAELMSNWPAPTGNEDIEQRRTFWLLRAFYFLDDLPDTYWLWLKADKDTVLLFHGRSGQFPSSDYSSWPTLTSDKIESILDAFIGQWPKIDLPSSWGTDSPKEENAYRYLTDVIWSIGSDEPDAAIPVLDRLLADPRFVDLHRDMESIRASQVRNKALRDFEPPAAEDIVRLLNHDDVVTVYGLRQLAIQELTDFQKAIDGGEFNSADRFYEKGERLGEVRSTEIIAERLNLRLEPQGISVTPEHQLKEAKRSDFTLTKLLDGKRRLLVTEVKGQWHDELYTAAAAQLHERYSIHPDAEQQGIYLVIWFGASEKVAGLKAHGLKSALELKDTIEQSLPTELQGLIDVFVLDVSKSK